jgi:uncharacterized coiled-coil DUF342 family protein
MYSYKRATEEQLKLKDFEDFRTFIGSLIDTIGQWESQDERWDAIKTGYKMDLIGLQDEVDDLRQLVNDVREERDDLIDELEEKRNAQAKVAKAWSEMMAERDQALADNHGLIAYKRHSLKVIDFLLGGG